MKVGKGSFRRLAIGTTLTVAMMMPIMSFGYTDVANNHWAYGKIEALSGKSAFTEIAGAEFYPNKQITREEFFTIVIKTIYGKQTAVGQLPFEDGQKVSENMKPYLAKAYSEGILAGTEVSGKKYIQPTNTITRQEGAVIISRILKLTSDEPLIFTDSKDIAKYAYTGVSGLRQTGIINGYPDGSFNPKGSITRAESASMLYSLNERTGLSTNKLSVFAGSGRAGNEGEALKTAEFFQPTGITGDVAGNLYVTDTENNQIRMISDGKVSILSGLVVGRDLYNKVLGGFRDGENKAVIFNKPTYLVMNSKSVLVVSDSDNNMLRLVGKTKTATLAGNKEAGYVNGTTTQSRFNNPGQVAIDKDDNVYVCDTMNNVIRKVDSKGNTSLVAGVPNKKGYLDGDAKSATFNEPVGIAIAKDGTLYVSDTGNQRIRKISNGKVTTLAGGGTDTLTGTDYIYGEYADGKGSNARFNFPMGIHLIDDKYLMVADSKNHVIRKVSTSGEVQTIAGNGAPGNAEGTAFSAGLNNPMDVYYSSGNLYITEQATNRIRVLDFRIK